MRAVRVEQLTVEPLSVPTVDPFVIASGQVKATRSVLVQVTLIDSKGARQVGLGEGACLPPVTREDQPDALASPCGARTRRCMAMRSSTADAVQ